MADTTSEFIALQQVVIGRYSLERELGRGGMGIVFLARDVALDRPVAIKLLPPAMASQPALKERFVREAQLAAKLSHPNIIPIYSVETAGDMVFFVMAYVEGETLGQRLRGKGPLNPRDATKLLQEVAWALAYAHLRGIVHRDVKPDNILLESTTGRALVSDFGIARVTDASGGTAVGEVLGTAQYMSPEQACGEPVDGRSDLYSLGVVGFFAVTGKLPFDAPDIPALLAQQITRPAPPVAGVQPAVPKRLAETIDRCLLKDPAQRFQTGEQLAEALAQETAVARETPAPVRVWVTRGDGVRAILLGWTALLTIGTVVDVIQTLMGHGEGLLDNVLGYAIPWAFYLFYRGVQTQRLVSIGYGYDDLRRALREHMEARREELTFEYDRAPTLVGRVIRWISFGGLAAVAAGALLPYAVSGFPEEVMGALIGVGALVGITGAGIGMALPGRRIKPRNRMLEWRLKFMESRLGRWVFRVESAGARRGVPAAAINRPTEMAIGMASVALFEGLPKETRRQLKDLPLVIQRLEADAAAQRARVDELDAMLKGPLGGAAASASLKLDGGRAAGVVAEHERKLKDDLAAQRDAAAGRLAASVAALENLRLDLLRLTAGVGTVDALSADLSAARDLQQEIGHAIAGQREVRALLGEKTPAP